MARNPDGSFDWVKTSAGDEFAKPDANALKRS